MLTRTHANEGRRRVREAELVYVMSEGGGLDGHRHCCRLDHGCNGATAPAGPDRHTHLIVQGELEAAADGHTHELSARRCVGRRHTSDGDCVPPGEDGAGR